MREKFVVDGVVVDEDFKEDVRRPRAADFFKIRLERLLPLMEFNC
jgi:adenine-specific DNA methylase